MVKATLVRCIKSSSGKPKCEISWRVTSIANVAAPRAAAIWKRAILGSFAGDVMSTLTVNQARYSYSRKGRGAVRVGDVKCRKLSTIIFHHAWQLFLPNLPLQYSNSALQHFVSCASHVIKHISCEHTDTKIIRLIISRRWSQKTLESRPNHGSP